MTTTKILNTQLINEGQIQSADVLIEDTLHYP